MSGSMRDERWVIGLLRAFRLERGGEVVARFEGRKEELLLAYLALAPQTAHRRTSVAEALWPGKDTAAARRGLSYSLCILREQLRKLGLPDGIYVGAQTLQINPKVGTDVQRFGELVLAAAHTAAPAEQARLLEQAVALYGDGLLPSYDQDWIVTRRAQLDEVYQGALRQLSGMLQSAGELYPSLKNIPSSAWGGYRQAAPELGGLGSDGVMVTEGAEHPPPATDPKALLAFAQAAEPHLAGPERATWLDRIDERYPEIQSVLDAAVEKGGSRNGLPLATALWRYWYERGMADRGRWYIEQLLPARSGPPSERNARALHAAGSLAMVDRDFDSASRRLNEALAMWRRLDDDKGLSRTLGNLGCVAYQIGDLDRARALLGESVAISRRLGDSHALLPRLQNLVLVEIESGAAASARALSEERLALAEQLGDARASASCLAHLAAVDLMDGEPARAAERAAEVTRRYRALGVLRGEALGLRLSGRAAHEAGDYQVALRQYLLSLRVAHASGDMVEVGESLRYQAETYNAIGKYGRAASIARQSIDLLQAAGDTRRADKARALLAEIPVSRGRRAAASKVKVGAMAG